MRAKSMQMGGAESFEHVQKPATAIQDHVSSPNSFYNGPAWCIRPGANFINEFTTCFCLKNIVRSSYVKNRVSSNY